MKRAKRPAISVVMIVGSDHEITRLMKVFKMSYLDGFTR
jgi:hypothetical protein